MSSPTTFDERVHNTCSPHAPATWRSSSAATKCMWLVGSLLVAALVSAACGSQPAAAPETAPSSTDTVAADDTPLVREVQADLPELELEATGATIPAGRTLTGSEGHLYYRDQNLTELVRIDAETFEETARIAMDDLDDPLTGPDLGLGFLPASYGTETVAMVATGRHSVAFLDAETLDRRHLHEVGEEFRLGVANDLNEPHVWVSSYYTKEDAVAGVDNPMVAMEIDSVTSTRSRQVSLSFCGATAVVPLDDDHVVAEIECTSTVEVINVASGETVDVIPSFSASVTLAAATDAVWVSWPESGEVARIDRTTHEVMLLDLSPDDADYATLTRIYRMFERDGWLWLSAKDVDDRVIVMRVDLTTAEVTARAKLPRDFSSAAFFQTERGIVNGANGELFTFPLDGIDTAMPEVAHRPDRPVQPEAFEPATPDEKGVVEALLGGLDPDADFDDKVEFLVDGEAVREQAERMVELGEGRDVDVKVLHVEIVDDIAVAPVSLVVDTATLPPQGQPMRLERVDGRWKITSDSICELSEYIGVTPCMIL